MFPGFEERKLNVHQARERAAPKAKGFLSMKDYLALAASESRPSAVDHLDH
jgi:hypothetical protein